MMVVRGAALNYFIKIQFRAFSRTSLLLEFSRNFEYDIDNIKYNCHVLTSTLDSTGNTNFQASKRSISGTKKKSRFTC